MVLLISFPPRNILHKVNMPLSKYSSRAVSSNGKTDHELLTEARRRAVLAGRTEVCMWDFPPGPPDATIERLLRICGGDTSQTSSAINQSAILGPPETITQLAASELQRARALHGGDTHPPLHLFTLGEASTTLIALGLGDTVTHQCGSIDVTDVSFT